MKKVMFALMALCMVLIACEGPMGPPGRNGSDGVLTEAFDVTIHPRNWVEATSADRNDFYYEASVDALEITNRAYDVGLVYGYLVRRDLHNREYQTLLPYVMYGPNNSPGNPDNYSERYDFDFYPGKIWFRMTPSDRALGLPNSSMTFRIVVIW